MAPNLLLLHDATREQLLAVDHVFCQFSRSEVEAGPVGGAVDRLMELSDDNAIARHLEGRLTLMFEGYDDDPRELYEIPEVVQFFRSLTEAWPFWFHFLEREGDSLCVAMRLLTDVRLLSRQRGQVRADIDFADYQRELNRLFEGMNGLHERLGYRPAETVRATGAILRRVRAERPSED